LISTKVQFYTGYSNAFPAFFGAVLGKKPQADKGIHPSAMDRLLRHEWPGNVRELMNAVERAVVLASPAAWHNQKDAP